MGYKGSIYHAGETVILCIDNPPHKRGAVFTVLKLKKSNPARLDVTNGKDLLSLHPSCFVHLDR